MNLTWRELLEQLSRKALDSADEDDLEAEPPYIAMAHAPGRPDRLLVHAGDPGDGLGQHVGLGEDPHFRHAKLGS